MEDLQSQLDEVNRMIETLEQNQILRERMEARNQARSEYERLQYQSMPASAKRGDKKVQVVPINYPRRDPSNN